MQAARSKQKPFIACWFLTLFVLRPCCKVFRNVGRFLHSTTRQTMVAFIVTAVKTSHLTENITGMIAAERVRTVKVSDKNKEDKSNTTINTTSQENREIFH